MSDENIIFAPKQDGWTYILFTRKDDVREEFASTKGTVYKGYHEFDLTYTFVVTNSDTVYSGVTFFDYDGSTLKETQLVEYGKNAVPPLDPTRSMFKFTGWNPDYRNVRTDLSCYA